MASSPVQLIVPANHSFTLTQLLKKQMMTEVSLPFLLDVMDATISHAKTHDECSKLEAHRAALADFPNQMGLPLPAISIKMIVSHIRPIEEKNGDLKSRNFSRAVLSLGAAGIGIGLAIVGFPIPGAVLGLVGLGASGYFGKQALFFQKKEREATTVHQIAVMWSKAVIRYAVAMNNYLEMSTDLRPTSPPTVYL